ncbi:MAG: glutathione S-transferase N-terminal domain-containing protein, partial [Chrysiogenetes bacterium]|nr:glutathione S-transferase N-terminal domain-containing protein [Chrysiogenetes bacterium]
MPHTYWLYGSELSPFSLKLRAMCDYVALPYTWVPGEGTRWQAIAASALVEAARRGRVNIHYPRMSELDELPLVPFLIEDRRRVMYDSTALASWLDARAPHAAPLIPADPALAFVAAWLDEAFDEFGLYLVHHNRWVVSAADNNAGERLGREYSVLTGKRLGKR